MPRGHGASLDGLLLAVEIVSPSSVTMDEVNKMREYAAAGIPRYWIVAQDEAQTVDMYVLGPDRTYEMAAKVPLAEVLRSLPGNYGLDGPAR
ncbi:Uma2 family endonuclease [Actinoplanes sp. NPDC051494]|uniref:Uma2 family endonuclease n=1 Tax=Actinoplanes sp. NPDC051494 TaxID=3363907 RepID=UPI0037A7A986